MDVQGIQMIVIIDYGMGNLHSVKKAVDYLGYNGLISRKKSDIIEAEKIILPGVGAFPKAMENLDKYNLIVV